VSRENVEILRRANAAFNRGDVDEALSHYDPDVVWRDLAHPPDSSEYVRGIPALREIWEGWKASGTLKANVEEYIDADDAVVCVTSWSLLGAGSGLVIDTTYAEVYEFEEGIVVRATVGYPTRRAALKAVGIEE
jgi:ketosteroid isomerase-like protein